MSQYICPTIVCLCVCAYIPKFSEAKYYRICSVFPVVILFPSYFMPLNEFKWIVLKTQSSKVSAMQEVTHIAHSGFNAHEINPWIKSCEPVNLIHSTKTFLPKCNCHPKLPYKKEINIDLFIKFLILRRIIFVKKQGEKNNLRQEASMKCFSPTG